MNTIFNIDSPRKVGAPFRIPEGYFNQLTQNVMQKVSTLNVPHDDRQQLLRWLPLVGAACITALSFTFMHISTVQGSGLSVEALQSTSSAESSRYAEAEYAYDYLMTVNVASTDNYATNQ